MAKHATTDDSAYASVSMIASRLARFADARFAENAGNGFAHE
jgi:hypothetical protein